MDDKLDNSVNFHKHSSLRCCCGNTDMGHPGISRRKFVQMTGAGTLGIITIQRLTWDMLANERPVDEYLPARQPLVVKPVLTYEVPERREKTSWRAWGGIQTENDASAEITRINSELKKLKSDADFPVDFLPVSAVRSRQDLAGIADIDRADLILIYAAGGGMNIFAELNNRGKDIIFFCRHRSGPVYLWYEIISPRYLRQHTDELKVKGVDDSDVVIDSQVELLWRMRALCGLKNTRGSRILAIGGFGAWSQPLETTMKLVKEHYNFEIRNISYENLGNLIKEAREDRALVQQAKSRSDRYLADTGIKLETERKYVENCFVLGEVFRRLMEREGCRAITVNNCMGTIMPIADTTACLTLSLLNDAGFLAFCESDFVVIPAGILLANISGKPSFLNDPTYPHDGLITLAHCTAPRRMNGKTLEPARIMTHFESDFGAAPKVEMKKDQMVTNVIPDFEFKKYIGLTGRIVENPFMDICRSQIEVSFDCDSRKVAENMRGFHWITVYGDYIKETEYALKKAGIRFEILT
ncbi:MAG: hypothetical protein WBJ37_07735 [Bacteroidales bacterium]